MKDDRPNEGRLLRFRHRRSSDVPGAQTPVEDLAKFQRAEEPDDYRQRMLTNVAAFAFILALIGAGLWLADTMAAIRKNQDCVLSGRRNCAPVSVDPQPRW
jgi:hypothetical protein